LLNYRLLSTPLVRRRAYNTDGLWIKSDWGKDAEVSNIMGSRGFAPGGGLRAKPPPR